MHRNKWWHLSTLTHRIFLGNKPPFTCIRKSGFESGYETGSHSLTWAMFTWAISLSWYNDASEVIHS